LATLPNNTDLLTNLATIAFQKGNLEVGIEIIARSLRINPNQPTAWNNQGNALRELKRLDEALVCCDRAVALKPDFALAYLNRGFVLHELKRLDDALASLDRAIALQPDYADAFLNRGNVLRDLGQLDEALDSLDRAISLNPGFAVAHFNRGTVLRSLKRDDDALASYDRAIALKADYAEAYCNRGIALQSLKRENDALASYDRAIALKADYAEAYSNRGSALRTLKRLDESIESYDRAIVLNPDFAAAYSNRGLALQSIKRLDEALESYDRAIALQPDFALAYWNKSTLRILKGEYLEGWELYEWRWKLEKFNNMSIPYAQCLWLGNESLTGRTLLIHREQGFGDYIQFIRYALLAEQAGARVILEVPAPLMALVSTLKGNFTLVETGAPLPEFDYHCPVMSLPLAFKTTVETIPAQIPYLYADEAKKKQWCKNLGEKTKPRIGLVWSGTPNHRNDHNRSFPLRQLSDLLDLPFEFHSLQKDVRAVDIDALEEFSQVHQHQDDLLDFSDTAALVEQMDIVISVDTSVAHLAGAMGKSLFVLLPYVPDYRWMLDRSDSPWYPTARLFRQPALYDWDSVIAEVGQVLMEGAWLKEPKDRDQMDRLSSTR
jgi:tetratricopeptide (TPR) repeat protein